MIEGPWRWMIHDHSMASLLGKPKENTDGHIMSVSPCPACAGRADPKEWQWGRCCTPYDDDARLIAAAPEFYHAAIVGAQVNLPDLMEWVAARLIRFGDSPNVDFVHTLRDRAKLLRSAIAKAEGRPE